MARLRLREPSPLLLRNDVVVPGTSTTAAELVRLRQENEQLTRQLAAAEAIIEIQKKVSSLLALTQPNAKHRREVLMEAIATLAPSVGVVSACQALGIARARFYRLACPRVRIPTPLSETAPPRVSPRALDAKRTPGDSRRASLLAFSGLLAHRGLRHPPR